MPRAQFLELIKFLDQYFSSESNKEKIELFIDKAINENPWFTDSLVRNAMSAIGQQFFSVPVWQDFFNHYPKESNSFLQIGLVLPGNLPAIGMHDVLMVLASGQQANLKLSSQDKSLMQMYVTAMKEFYPNIPIAFIERLQGMDAVIATGSDFSSGYFSQYFSNIPHIIRKNRSSLAVLSGHESDQEFQGLANDILTYYGLGCRNVSTLAVPHDYDLIPLFDILSKETWVLNHSKYSNNLQYYRTLYLLNQIEHYDLGNLIVTENDDLVSPIGVLYLFRYTDMDSLHVWMAQREEKIQCKVGMNVDFGQSQKPALDDFADGINTYDFLVNLT
jgi:hypothetical protein